MQFMQPSFRGASPLRASPESITPVPAMAYYVYILASKKHGTLYVGVINDLVRRGYEHRTKASAASRNDTTSTNLSGSRFTMTR